MNYYIKLKISKPKYSIAIRVINYLFKKEKCQVNIQDLDLYIWFISERLTKQSSHIRGEKLYSNYVHLNDFTYQS